ncbi:MAG: hypothetical protein ACR2J8_05370 [Thermomicrobiales bacterium]
MLGVQGEHFGELVVLGLFDRFRCAGTVGWELVHLLPVNEILLCVLHTGANVVLDREVE